MGISGEWKENGSYHIAWGLGCRPYGHIFAIMGSQVDV